MTHSTLSYLLQSMAECRALLDIAGRQLAQMEASIVHLLQQIPPAGPDNDGNDDDGALVPQSPPGAQAAPTRQSAATPHPKQPGYDAHGKTPQTNQTGYDARNDESYPIRTGYDTHAKTSYAVRPGYVRHTRLSHPVRHGYDANKFFPHLVRPVYDERPNTSHPTPTNNDFSGGMPPNPRPGAGATAAAPDEPGLRAALRVGLLKGQPRRVIGAAVAVLRFLHTHSGRQSYAQLAALTGLKERSMMLHMASLRRRGLVVHAAPRLHASTPAANLLVQYGLDRPAPPVPPPSA